jgi:hypothetical protein
MKYVRAVKAMPEWNAIVREVHAYNEELGKSLIAAEALQSVQTATTVRVRNGAVSTTDGPFCRDPGAVEWTLPDRSEGPERGHPGGLQAPGARLGCIEVRPTMS